MSNYIRYFSYPAMGAGGGGLGSVTSVGLADASSTPIYTVSGSPVTSSGTLTLTLKTEAATTVFAGPATGAAAQPTFRALSLEDMPIGLGTVTSVGIADASVTPIFAAGGNVVVAGTLDLQLLVQVANVGLFGPTTGVAAQPTFRSLVAADLPSNVACAVAMTTASAASPNTNISFDTVVVDNASGFSVNHYTVPITGNYLVSGVICAAGAGPLIIYVVKNGTQIAQVAVIADANTPAGFSILLACVATNTISIQSDAGFTPASATLGVFANYLNITKV